MKLFKLLVSALLLGALGLGLMKMAEAQNTATPVAVVVDDCGSASYLAGRSAPLTVNLNGQVC